jgi:hypothetical protein
MAHNMTSKYFWCGVLIVALSMVLATPGRADKLQTEGEEIVIGIVAVGVAVVVATVLIIDYSKKRKITGCVNSGRAGRLPPTEKTSESMCSPTTQ